MVKTNKSNVSPTREYMQALETIRDKVGVNLEINPFVGSEFAFHQIYLAKSPASERGITYSDDFQWWKAISREELPDVEDKLSVAVNDAEDLSVAKAMSILLPIFDIDAPKAVSNRLNIIVKRLLKLDPDKETERGICIIPESNEKYYEEYETSPDLPKAFLPSKSMFSKELQELIIEDFLTILGKHEQKIYALAIGRALVGATDTTHAKTGRIIKHSWRTAPVLTGMPGIGKSTLTKALNKAIRTVGYKAAEFSNLNKQFGIADIITADLAYADDFNETAFKNYINSPIVKQAITGGEIRTEKKFLDEVVTTPKALFLSNINDFNINITYGTDDGVLDRLKILNCRMPTQFNEVKKDFTGIAKNSPNLHPIPHLEWLADKLDCSENALMLRFARLCVDMFLDEMDDKTLNNTINSVTSKLTIQLHKHYEKVIAMVFQLSYIMRRAENFNKSLPDLKPALLGKCIKAVNLLVNDGRFHFLREEIKQDWKENKRPSYHPWTGIKLLDQISVANAFDAFETCVSSFAEKELDKAVKTIFSSIRLNQGYNVPANTAQIIRAWEGSNQQINNLHKITARLRKNVDPIFIAEFTCEDCLPYTDHIREETYDRQSYADERNENPELVYALLQHNPKTKPRHNSTRRTNDV